ncbi:MAG: hypothetical protein IKK81_03440 [Prevotella sp.]|nr:hypothetical protein [Prevotella sp.]
MRKRLQNRISGNRLTLPVIAFYASVIWLACGLINHQWWIQFACFALSSYLMIELNNRNALIRIYSKMVSCAFLVLTVAACFMFSDIREPVAVLLVIATYIMLFRSYQDTNATGTVYYAFLCIGLASMSYVQMLYSLLPFWLMMLFFMQSMSVKTFWASVFGVLTPYWFAAAYFLYYADFSIPLAHFSGLFDFPNVLQLASLTMQQTIVLVFVTVLMMIGCVHFLNTSYNDKIRIRMMYYSFIFMGFLSLVFLLLQPHHYKLLMRMMIINTSPLIAHFIALTSTRITNVAFCTIVAIALIITGFNVWITL